MRRECGPCTAFTVSGNKCKNKAACGSGNYKFCKIHAGVQNKRKQIAKAKRPAVKKGKIEKQPLRFGNMPFPDVKKAIEGNVNWITGEGLANKLVVVNSCESGVEGAQRMGHDIFGRSFSSRAWEKAFADQAGTGSMAPCLAAEECMKMRLWKKWAFVKYIGSGAYGSVILVRDRKTGKRRVAKFSRKFDKKRDKQEFEIQNAFWRHGLAPKAIELMYDDVKHSKSQKKVSIILMQQVDSTLQSWLRDARKKWELDVMLKVLIAFIDKMMRKQLRHGDLHWDNIAFKYKPGTKTIGRVILIDFGFADRRPDPMVEFAQLIRTTHKNYNKRNKYMENMDYLRTKLIAEFKRRFKVNHVSQNMVEDIYRGQ